MSILSVIFPIIGSKLFHHVFQFVFSMIQSPLNFVFPQPKLTRQVTTNVSTKRESAREGCRCEREVHFNTTSK